MFQVFSVWSQWRRWSKGMGARLVGVMWTELLVINQLFVKL